MKDLKNVTLRKQIMKKGLLMKDIAGQMGITAGALSHIFAHDLRPYEKERIETAINELLEKDLNNGKKQNQIQA